MPEATPRNAPLPVVQVFLPCRDIFLDNRTRTHILVAPTMSVTLPVFPGHARLSFYAEFTGGHGSYLPSLTLRDDHDQVVWTLSVHEPFVLDNPLALHCQVFHDYMVAVPRPGRYLLGLLLNGELTAQRRITLKTPG